MRLSQSAEAGSSAASLYLQRRMLLSHAVCAALPRRWRSCGDVARTAGAALLRRVRLLGEHRRKQEVLRLVQDRPEQLSVMFREMIGRVKNARRSSPMMDLFVCLRLGWRGCSLDCYRVACQVLLHAAKDRAGDSIFTETMLLAIDDTLCCAAVREVRLNYTANGATHRFDASCCRG